MGIRTLHRRTPEADTRAWADTASAQALPASPVPALAADASTARIPADLAETVRTAATVLRRRLTGPAARTDHVPDWRQWADLARGYLALALTLIPRSRPRPTLTVFVASLTERPAAPDPQRPPHRDLRDRRDLQDRPAPGPDATP
ncbi:hypothetical protein A6P39_030740 [Streptomyces sp. FXJ1.172]|uniref:hypothetical protein n=1 Tax=Streptomyces sp. FXJ1.172 TaxID=710705 RepID=UPI00082AC54B|nr:hypothetical protein [Streptomyces sp. FXJ1.172]WEO98052.1 hypothetical protein A6P39_030740 [Streptomyces sp. FXJ1.172]